MYLVPYPEAPCCTCGLVFTCGPWWSCLTFILGPSTVRRNVSSSGLQILHYSLLVTQVHWSGNSKLTGWLTKFGIKHGLLLCVKWTKSFSKLITSDMFFVPASKVLLCLRMFFRLQHPPPDSVWRGGECPRISQLHLKWFSHKLNCLEVSQSYNRCFFGGKFHEINSDQEEKKQDEQILWLLYTDWDLLSLMLSLVFLCFFV